MIRLWSAFNSLISTPAQKPRPSARITITRTAGLAPSALISAASPCQPAALSAFTGGRSNTSSATPLSCSVETYWLVICCSLSLEIITIDYCAALSGLRHHAIHHFTARLQLIDQRRHLPGRHYPLLRLAIHHRLLQQHRRVRGHDRLRD